MGAFIYLLSSLSQAPHLSNRQETLFRWSQPSSVPRLLSLSRVPPLLGAAGSWLTSGVKVGIHTLSAQSSALKTLVLKTQTLWTTCSRVTLFLKRSGGLIP